MYSRSRLLLAAKFLLVLVFGLITNNRCFAESLPTTPIAKPLTDAEILTFAQNGVLALCAALTLFLIAPGLAMFYAGLVRKKNVLNTLIQCIGLMALLSVLWYAIGYSLTFARGGSLDGFIGGMEFSMGQGIQQRWEGARNASITPMLQVNGHDTSITRLSHLFFECMLFMLAPVLLCGAFAERMKFRSMILFASLWSLVVYCPIAHWLWGGGFMTFGGHSWLGGALDFGGGFAVHISCGFSALVGSITVGPRLGKGREPMPPHNVTYTAIGAAMLWFGWIGMMLGCALGAWKIGPSVVLTTHLAGASGAIAWGAIEWIKRGKPSVLGVSSGLLSGLVCITPAAGYVQPNIALVMGACGGLASYFACAVLKQKLRYDDTLDVFGVHGVAGTIGCLLTGLFATRSVWDSPPGKALGLLEGGSVMTAQVIAVLLTIGYSIAASLILLKVIELTIGLRASSAEERQGLDITQHGEEGYIFL